MARVNLISGACLHAGSVATTAMWLPLGLAVMLRTACLGASALR